MSYEDEYTTLPTGRRRSHTTRRMSLEDEDEKEQEERRYREAMASAASYMQKIRSKQAAESSSTDTSSTLKDDISISEIEGRTSKTSQFSTSDTSGLRRLVRPARLATSSSGSIRPSRLSFRASNASRLADLANKNTISKDNTTGDEEREAKLLANMGKKICNTRQQARKFEAGQGERRNRGSWTTVGGGLSEALGEDLV